MPPITQIIMFQGKKLHFRLKNLHLCNTKRTVLDVDQAAPGAHPGCFARPRFCAGAIGGTLLAAVARLARFRRTGTAADIVIFGHGAFYRLAAWGGALAPWQRAAVDLALTREVLQAYELLAARRCPRRTEGACGAGDLGGRVADARRRRCELEAGRAGGLLELVHALMLVVPAAALESRRGDVGPVVAYEVAQPARLVAIPRAGGAHLARGDLAGRDAGGASEQQQRGRRHDKQPHKSLAAV